MNLQQLIDQIKQHPDYAQAGMILCHNGVVRATSRDGRKVTGLSVRVDYDTLRHIIKKHKNRPGIIEILVIIFDQKRLSVGDDVMYLVVAGDIRENVIDTFRDTLNAIKETVTQKTEYFVS